jgi:hypothetical protein
MAPRKAIPMCGFQAKPSTQSYLGRVGLELRPQLLQNSFSLLAEKIEQSVLSGGCAVLQLQLSDNAPLVFDFRLCSPETGMKLILALGSQTARGSLNWQGQPIPDP